jgi:nitroreductase
LKNDGSLNLRGEVTPLMKLLLQRRSRRKYAEGTATPGQVAAILGCARAFQERCGLTAPRIEILAGEERDRVVKAAMKGAVGAVNPWLAFTRAEQLMVCSAVCPRDPAGHDLAIKQAAMVMQIAILAATELGLGTCWMAGINHERIEQLCARPDSAEVIAISPLGLPSARMGLSWDAMLYHLAAKRRKPLDALWMAERWGERP